MYKELEEENKKLKEWNNELIENHKKDIDVLCKENKKLKKYYDRDKEELMESCYWLARENDELKKENEKLNEKVRFLEQCLDNKEKLNEEYRKQIDKLRTDNVYEEWLYD